MTTIPPYGPLPDSACEILGVSTSASCGEVASAYRALAQQYHPDKVAHLGREFRELADQKMKVINSAYAELQRALNIGDEGRANLRDQADHRGTFGNPSVRDNARSRTRPRKVRVNIDGRGDYPNLEGALQRVPVGSTIVLGWGIHRLRRPLNVSYAINLVGEGKDYTRVVCASQGHVVHFDGPGPFEVQDVTFEHQGDLAANVVVVASGMAVFDRCRFTGARALAEGDNVADSSGLRFGGSASGTVRNCEALSNGKYGILVSGSASPALEANACDLNTLCGIAYFGNAVGVACGNVCSGNPAGITVGDQAQPTLEGNACQALSTGIQFSGNSAGVARRNTCNAGGTGILVTGEATPILEANTFARGQTACIAYSKNAGGIARNNECYENFWGITVGDYAEPLLENNICQLNTFGIEYCDFASGWARHNICDRNRDNGISITGQASPKLHGNTCRGNGFSGIRLIDQAHPSIGDTTYGDNGTGDLAIEGDARVIPL